MKNALLRLIIFCLVLLLIGVAAMLIFYQPSSTENFNADRAYMDVIYQTSLGARTPGSSAHDEVIQYISKELVDAGWQVEIQHAEQLGHPVSNIIARRGDGPGWVIFGAHYDSRLLADREPDVNLRNQPVPGANDGASGVAVLLELARSIPENLEKEVWLVFFDLEDQGNIETWDWILGSRAFAESLEGKPDAVIIVDMVGDADLNIYREKNSNPALTDQIWSLAEELGYSGIFINKPKYSILDDHTPFIEKGITAIDIIDFDYPFWHTVNDTADKVAAQSLETVGRVLLAWITR